MSNERAQLLSDNEFFDLFDHLPYGATRKQYISESDYQAASKIIDFYEAKISSGELMVVKDGDLEMGIRERQLRLRIRCYRLL